MVAQDCPNTLPFDRRTVTAILRGRLPSGEARERARLVLEDVPRLRCPLRLRFMEQEDGQVWPYYVFNGFEGQAPLVRSEPPLARKTVGYGLNWGDLVTLSKVVHLARGLWGWHWVRRFRERMSSMANHLAVVEELWWLSLWEEPRAVQQECSPFPSCNRTVDWQFETRGLVINLEVKYRPYDWVRFVDASHYSSLLDTYFDTLREKFPRKLSGQMNLVGMTLFGSLGSELRSRAAAFLEAHPPLDGFLFWGIARRDSLDCECVLRPENDFVRALLRPADEEDRWRNPFIVPPTLQPERRAGTLRASFNPLHGLFDTRAPDFMMHRPRVAPQSSLP